MNYTLDFIRENNLIIFEAKMGSHAYGTNIPTSDVDIRGIFIQPLEDILKYGYTEQVADKTNDIVFYELKRFMDLVKSNNPNILELLNAPQDCIIWKSPVYDFILENAQKFITTKCKFTFAGYAIEQIRKARGYNKKMNWEESEMKRKTVLDFCYILDDGKTISLDKWLEQVNEFQDFEGEVLKQNHIGLANIDHAHDLYAMYDLSDTDIISGIVSDEEKANDVQLTSIPKGLEPIAYLTFNKDAYSVHCKKYKEYQTWLTERNEDRFKMNKEHGKNYDSKNMSHCIRLLDMAIEIGSGKGIIVRRSEEHRKLLLSIRHGEMEFEDLIKMAESKIELLDRTFDESDLPKTIDEEFIANLGMTIRKKFYNL